jgi:cytochrome c oxidase subunit 3
MLGMIMIGLRALKTPRFGHRTVPAIEFMSYYWHFVDVVWVALFLAIFVLK